MTPKFNNIPPSSRAERPEEKAAISCLCGYFRELLSVTNCCAEFEPEDPPDYWLHLGDKRYAVEVTSIAEKHPHAENQSMITYGKTVSKLCTDMTREAVRTGILNGLYILIIKGHPEIRPNRMQMQIQKNILAYVKQTEAAENADTADIFEDVAGQIQILKHGLEKNLITNFGPTSTRWGAETQSILAVLLRDCLADKKRKLANKGIRLDDVILVLIDAFLWGDQEDWEAAISQIPEANQYHSVFWLPEMNHEVPRFLHSAEGAWMNVSSRCQDERARESMTQED